MKRIAALLLTLVMVLTLIPAMAAPALPRALPAM